ncbi:hypothetical protein CC86DRAFT_109792 [Ophiobolus disseminans]|uniref:Uncharacterized protein n=1 Tax=Ophiobolus disseminans TaxID=1469910 RepID=A0A6A6ZK60_9PLEO|nr:hypothetical protein CC86DRAFT_109792 [Ophiobolus disseminans]
MLCAKVTMPSCPSHAFVTFVSTAGPRNSPDADRERYIYLSFFLGRSWLVWPHFFLRCKCVSRGTSIAMLLVRFSCGVWMQSGCAGAAGTYAVDSPRWQTCVALAADHLIAVVLGGERLERRLDDATTETEDQVEG